MIANKSVESIRFPVCSCMHSASYTDRQRSTEARGKEASDHAEQLGLRSQRAGGKLDCPHGRSFRNDSKNGTATHMTHAGRNAAFLGGGSISASQASPILVPTKCMGGGQSSVSHYRSLQTGRTITHPPATLSLRRSAKKCPLCRTVNQVSQGTFVSREHGTVLKESETLSRASCGCMRQPD